MEKVYPKRGVNGMKSIMRKCMVFISVLLLILSQIIPVAFASETEYAAPFAKTLNSAMLNCGVVSTSGVGDFVDITKYCPTGVLYADTVNFKNGADACLIIVYSDGNSRCICTDIYRYKSKEKSAEIITTLKKPYAVASGHIAELALADAGDYRYIVYTEYMGEDKIAEECYTVIDNDAFMQITPTKLYSGISSFGGGYIILQ